MRHIRFLLTAGLLLIIACDVKNHVGNIVDVTPELLNSANGFSNFMVKLKSECSRPESKDFIKDVIFNLYNNVSNLEQKVKKAREDTVKKRGGLLRDDSIDDDCIQKDDKKVMFNKCDYEDGELSGSVGYDKSSCNSTFVYKNEHYTIRIKANLLSTSDGLNGEVNIYFDQNNSKMPDEEVHSIIKLDLSSLKYDRYLGCATSGSIHVRKDTAYGRSAAFQPFDFNISIDSCNSMDVYVTEDLQKVGE